MLNKILFEMERKFLSYRETPSTFDDVFVLASYPKSGNTWLRFVFGNVVAISCGEDCVDFWSVGRYAPEIKYDRTLEGIIRSPFAPNALKTHFSYIKSYQKLSCVLLYRNPEKAIKSYYDYMRREVGKNYSSFQSFLNDPRRGVDYWRYFHLSWLKSQAIFVQYEDLIKAPVDGVCKIYESLGVEVDRNIVEKALELSSKENMALIEAQKGDPYKKSSDYDFVNKQSERNGLGDTELNELHSAVVGLAGIYESLNHRKLLF